MKRIFFTGLLALAISSCNTKDQIANNQVPSVVLNTFQQQYAEAADVEWEKQSSNFEVEFELDNVDYTALINSQGTILKSKRDATVDEIPENITSKVKADFANYTVDDVEIVEEDNTRYFQLELDGKLMGKEIVVSETGEVLDTKFWD